MCGSGKEENRMLQLLSGSQRTVDALGFLLAFALTALMDSVFREKLPHDHGRAFAVNGELSKGKARGSGLIFVLCIALVTLAVVPLRTARSAMARVSYKSRAPSSSPGRMCVCRSVKAAPPFV